MTCEEDEDRSDIPCSVREEIMGKTLQLGLRSGKCPFGDVFSAMIVRHHAPPSLAYDVICIGTNNFAVAGFTGHGEIEALRNCSTIVGQIYGSSYITNKTFWHELSLYTTGEPCPMCMSAIRFTALKEVIYATSIEYLHDHNWPQISLFTRDIQRASNLCNFGGDGTARQTAAVKGVLKDVTNPYFAWQFSSNPDCPPGCVATPGFPACQEPVTPTPVPKRR
jgi:tRNA(Arg) A34 adenosine deaminase TadA